MQKPQPKSTHDLIEEARALIIAVSAASIGAERMPETLDFTFSADIQRALLSRANELLLVAAGEVGCHA